MTLFPDITIIGGGPAGCAAAIHLQKRGQTVRLFEKQKMPRSKVCGGFLSSEGMDELHTLDLAKDLASRSHTIRRAVLADGSGLAAEHALPRPAFALVRDHLDAALWTRVQKLGIRAQDACRVSPLPTNHSPFIVAGGRKAAFEGKRIAPFGYYGLQALFKTVKGVTDQVELDFVSGGYVGLTRVDSERVNVCALVHPHALRGQSDLDSRLRAWMNVSQPLKNHLFEASRLTPWQTTGPVQMGFKQLVREKTFFIGDAACVVDPFVGDGISMALSSARLLADSFRSSPHQAAPIYEQAWKSRFRWPVLIGSGLRWIANQPWGPAAAVGIASRWPSSLEWSYRNTRDLPS